MNDFPAFAFSTVAHIVSELGAARKLGQHVRSRFPSAQRALLVTDPGFLRTGLVQAPADSLAAAGFHVKIYSDVVADPPEQIVLAAVAAAREHDADLIIGLGGGSSMDVAKLIAVLAGSEQPLPAIYGIGNVKGARDVERTWSRSVAPMAAMSAAVITVATAGARRSGCALPVAMLTDDLPPYTSASSSSSLRSAAPARASSSGDRAASAAMMPVATWLAALLSWVRLLVCCALATVVLLAGALALPLALAAEAVQGCKQGFERPGQQGLAGFVAFMLLKSRQALGLKHALSLVGKQHRIAVKGQGRMGVDLRCGHARIERSTHIREVGRQEQVGVQ
eukprot:gene22476-28603_t